MDSTDGFDKGLLEMLCGLKLRPLDDIHNSLADDTMILPTIVPAKHCWKPVPPRLRHLLRETLECSDYTMFRRGEVDAKATRVEAIAQLVDPDPTDPIFVTGLRLSCISDDLFEVPMQLSRVVESFFETNT